MMVEDLGRDPGSRPVRCLRALMTKMAPSDGLKANSPNTSDTDLPGLRRVPTVVLEQCADAFATPDLALRPADVNIGIDQAIPMPWWFRSR